MFQAMRAIDKTGAVDRARMTAEIAMLADPRPVPLLDAVEWTAVAIALRDAERDVWLAPEPRSLRGRLARLYTRLTGQRPARPLADPRLDTLRRFVDATRRTRAMAEPLVPAMIAQGFSRAQVEAIALLSA